MRNHRCQNSYARAYAIFANDIQHGYISVNHNIVRTMINYCCWLNFLERERCNDEAGNGGKSITDRPEMHPVNEIRKVWLHKLELTIEAEAGLERVKSRAGSLD